MLNAYGVAMNSRKQSFAHSVREISRNITARFAHFMMTKENRKAFSIAKSVEFAELAVEIIFSTVTLVDVA